MMNHRYILLYCTLLLLAACDSTDPDEEANEEENITTVVLALEAPDRSVFTAQWRDVDGAGGVDPQIDDLSIRAGVVYSGTVRFLDESDAAAPGDLTAEIQEEAEAHQVFYTLEGNLVGNATLTYDDQDANGLPLGLRFTLTVNADPPIFGELRIVLSHYDDSPKDGQTPSPETDVEVVFEINVLG